MKTFKAVVIDILKDKGCIYTSINPFMDHIQIKIPENINFDQSFIDIEKTVRECLDKHLPEREEDVLVEVTNVNHEKTFKIIRTESPPKASSPAATEFQKSED